MTKNLSPPNDADPQAQASTEDERESFGAWLRREREMRDISLREIADTSKISLRYLQALEDERFELLPAPVFAKGFLRQYARYVGLDPEEAVNFFLAASRDDEEETESEPPPVRTKPFPFVMAALALAIVLVAVAWALTLLSRDAGEEADGLGGAVPAVEEPPGEALVPVAPEPPGAPGSAVPALPQKAPLVVTLDFHGDCWVEASVDGELRVPGEMGVQGESMRFAAQDLVKLKVGDVTMVDLEVNGTPYTIETGPAVRELTIDLAVAEALAEDDD